MMLQYMSPVMMGESSPATTASMVSSSSLMPSATLPSWMAARPC
jgi:hypothetical protein